MAGKPHASITNRLSATWTLGERADAEETMRSLTEHPGWALMDSLVEQTLEAGMATLIHGGIKEQAEYAQKLAVLDGMTFHRDVVASVVASAQTARADLKRSAALEVAAEGSK